MSILFLSRISWVWRPIILISSNSSSGTWHLGSSSVPYHGLHLKCGNKSYHLLRVGNDNEKHFYWWISYSQIFNKWLKTNKSILWVATSESRGKSTKQKPLSIKFYLILIQQNMLDRNAKMKKTFHIRSVRIFQYERFFALKFL